MDVTKVFGTNVFNDAVMRRWLPKDTYKVLKKSIEQETQLPVEVADVVANAMKDWGIERGATHYEHSFEPLAGIPAEPHEVFI